MSQTPWVLDPNPLHQQQAKQLVSDLVDFTQDDPSDPTVLSQVQTMPVAVCNQFYFHVLDSKHNHLMDIPGLSLPDHVYACFVPIDYWTQTGAWIDRDPGLETWQTLLGLPQHWELDFYNETGEVTIYHENDAEKVTEILLNLGFQWDKSFQDSFDQSFGTQTAQETQQWIANLQQAGRLKGCPPASAPPSMGP